MRFYIEDYGCSLNKAETKIIEQHLIRANWERVSEEKAELIIVNTCGVKEPTENKIVRRLRELEKFNGRLIVYGCLVDINLLKLKEFEERGAKLIGLNPLELFKELGLEYQGLEPGFLEEPYVAIIPINQGCLGNCSFCATKNARGVLKSYSPALLRNCFRKALEKRNEIWLTSPDTGCYGFDIGTDLAELLKSFLREKGEFRIRIGMMNPNNYAKIEEKMLEVFKDKRVFRFIHLPLQSGSNRVLKEMNRPYGKEEFLGQVKRLREFDSKFCVSSDIIVGYPSETETEFKESLEVLGKAECDVVNISRFYSRPGTLDFEKKDMISRDKKERSREMSTFCREMSWKRNKLHTGLQRVLVDEKEKGRNDYYKVVLCSGEKGEFVEKEVTKAENFYLV